MVSKLDLAVIVALVAGCALWVENGHRVIIDAPTEDELAAVAAAAACPDNDTVPYSARCLEFLKGASVSGTSWQANEPAATVPTDAPRHTEVASLVPGAACPHNDNVPYSAGCLAFLKGATETGMRWRVSAPAMPAPVDAPK